MENINTDKENTIKIKILFLVIGILVGAVVSAAAFFIYLKVLGVGENGITQQAQSEATTGVPGGGIDQGQGGTPPEKPDGDDGQGETPPEKPDGDDGQGETPPEKPDEANNS